MKRRAFLSAALSAVPVSVAMAGDEPKRPSEEPRPKRPVMVAADADRFDKPVRFAVGHIECKVSAKDTDGALCVVEALTSAADRPARHLHHDQDEWFYVLAGEYDFEVGDEKFHLKAGDSLLAPRKVPHAWGCVSEKPGKLMAIFQPAGKMEAFFQELPKYAGKASREVMAKLFADHGMKITGPPLPPKQATGRR